jgi:hypothetical protein
MLQSLSGISEELIEKIRACTLTIDKIVDSDEETGMKILEMIKNSGQAE